MTSPDGGFYSAEDADSEGEEGKFYLWMAQQIREALEPQEADLFMRVYDIQPEGNYDERSAGNKTGKNIPHLSRSVEDWAHELGRPEKELRGQLANNSRNSSKPPSSDGYKKKPAFPKKKKGKQGGQPGHKGRTLQQVSHPDKTEKHKPGPCDCGHVFSDEELSVAETRQVFDLPKPRLEVTAHQLLKGKCPGCGKWHKGIAPMGVNAPVQYGYGVKTLAVLLNVDYRIPFKKIQILSLRNFVSVKLD